MKNNILKELGKEITIAVGMEVFKIGLDLFKSINSSIIILDEGELGFEKLNKVLYNIDPIKYSRYRIPTTEKAIDFQLSVGTNYIIKLKNRTFIHVHVSQNEKTKIKSIALSLHGPDKYKIREKISKGVANTKSKKYINSISVGNREFYNQSKLISISFDNIIIKNNIRNKIIGGLVGWYNDKNWYYENKMLHKIGILLYGKPGTGKSTIVKCISNMFGNANIYTVNGSDIKMSAMDIIHFRRTSPNDEILIVLFEDFDMFCKKRKEVDDDNNNNKIDADNLNSLFQMLDGVYSTDNTIYIATTNYIDKLDPALIRTGRFDIQIELDYFTKEESVEYIDKLSMDLSIIDDTNMKFPISPSDLRSIILSTRAKRYIEGGNSND